MPRQYTPRVPVECGWCKTITYHQPATVDRHKFCSRECRTASVWDGAKKRLLAKGVRTADGCLIWTGCRDRRGYGKIGVGMTLHKIHALSYELFVGPIPDGHGVHHRCNNPPCYEPSHLTTGTQKQNLEYMVECGRSTKGRPGTAAVRRGESNSGAKLTDDAVREIRRRYADGGISQKRIAQEYGVQQMTVSWIVRRKSWTHVT